MGFLWAIFWIPLAFLVVSRVRRRMGHLRGYCRYHRRSYRRDHEYEDEDPYWGELGGRGFDERGRGFDERERGFGPRGRGRMLFGLFRRLDATPGQEKAIRKLIEGISASLGDARGDFMAARRELAGALSGEVLDRAALDAAFTRNGELFSKLSGQLKATLVELHETLDSDQRKLLAELLAHGPWSGRPFGRHGYAL